MFGTWNERTWHARTNTTRRAKTCFKDRRAGPIHAQKVDWTTLLGGRGLGAGEKSLKTEQGAEKLFEGLERSVEDAKEETDVEDPKVSVDDEQGDENLEDIYIGKGKLIKDNPKKYPSKVSFGFFENVVGGWAGGEAGLWNFRKDVAEQKRLDKLAERRKKLMDAPKIKKLPQGVPMLLPGMNAKVINPENSFYEFIGIVQRVSDGYAAVLFEGGNWDKLQTFAVQDLERSKTGPPMVHPKSGILVQETEQEEEPTTSG